MMSENFKVSGLVEYPVVNDFQDQSFGSEKKNKSRSSQMVMRMEQEENEAPKYKLRNSDIATIK